MKSKKALCVSLAPCLHAIKTRSGLEVRTSPFNPRTIKPGALAKLADSITRDPSFMALRPIVIDETGQALGGNQRLRACVEILGLNVLPDEWVKAAPALTDDQKKRFMLIDNSPDGMSGEWDFETLRADWADISISMDDIGLTMPDLFNQGKSDPDAAPDAQPALVTRPGDIWKLGAHRVICGDMTSEAAAARLLGFEKPGLMVTDPPYGVDYDPTWRDNAGGQFGDGPTKARGLVANDDRVNWQAAWDLFPGDVAYVWHASLKCAEVCNSLTDAGFIPRAQIVWVKSHFTLMRTGYHWGHEPCWYVVRAGGKADWDGDRKQQTVWEIQGMNPAGRNRSSGNEKTGHGTQKPVECMARPMLNHAARLVYDPFLGSGTTLIAAEQTGRRCFAGELMPVYVDMAVRRWQNYTGNKAVRESDGLLFDEIQPREASDGDAY